MFPAALLALPLFFLAPGSVSGECDRVGKDKCQGECHGGQEAEVRVVSAQFESCVDGCSAGADGTVCRKACRDSLKASAAAAAQVFESCVESCPAAHGCAESAGALATRGAGDGTAVPAPGLRAECLVATDKCMGGCHETQEREKELAVSEYLACASGCAPGATARDCQKACRAPLLEITTAAGKAFIPCVDGCKAGSASATCGAQQTVARAVVMASIASDSGGGNAVDRDAATRAPSAKASVPTTIGRAQGAGLRR